MSKEEDRLQKIADFTICMSDVVNDLYENDRQLKKGETKRQILYNLKRMVGIIEWLIKKEE